MENILDFIITIITVLTVSIFFYYKYKFNYWKKKGVSTITPTFPFGNLSNPFFGGQGLTSRIGDLYKQFKEQNVKMGGIYALTTPLLMAIHPDFIKEVFSSDFHHFASRGNCALDDSEPISKHLFNIDGKEWKDMRVKLTPTFSSGKMKMMFNTLLLCGYQMEEYLHDRYKTCKEWDFKEIMACYTTDVIGSCAFGLDSNSFKNPNAEFRKFGRSVFLANTRRVIRRLLNVMAPSLVHKLKLKFLTEEEQAFFVGVVNDMVHYRHDNKITRNDFLQILINMEEEANKQGKKAFTINEMAAQSFLFFTAGFETSSSAMSYCFYELAHNQDIQDKFRKEVRETLEKHDGKFTYESIAEMKYVAQVIKEALRKYPPVPVLTRSCTNDYQLPNGQMIEKGTKILISLFGMQRDEEFFPDPDKFDPERFNDENKDKIHPFSFLPFGEGPRNCIGLRFGMLQTKIGMCQVIKDFKVSPGNDLKYPLCFRNNSSIILTNYEPIMLKVERV